MMKSFALAGALAAGLLAGTALTTQAEAQTLTIGVRAGPESIDPHWSTLGSHAVAQRHISDALV
ncbi:MAG: ABC transporter substrate-binding protein, partial [Salinarimonas sp.]